MTEFDGVSIAEQDKAIAWGKELVEYRAQFTADAIRKHLIEARR